MLRPKQPQPRIGGYCENRARWLPGWGCAACPVTRFITPKQASHSPNQLGRRPHGSARRGVDMVGGGSATTQGPGWARREKPAALAGKSGGSSFLTNLAVLDFGGAERIELRCARSIPGVSFEGRVPGQQTASRLSANRHLSNTDRWPTDQMDSPGSFVTYTRPHGPARGGGRVVQGQYFRAIGRELEWSDFSPLRKNTRGCATARVTVSHHSGLAMVGVWLDRRLRRRLVKLPGRFGCSDSWLQAVIECGTKWWARP